jgi:hypothetical protein
MTKMTFCPPENTARPLLRVQIAIVHTLINKGTARIQKMKFKKLESLKTLQKRFQLYSRTFYVIDPYIYGKRDFVVYGMTNGSSKSNAILSRYTYSMFVLSNYEVILSVPQKISRKRAQFC